MECQQDPTTALFGNGRFDQTLDYNFDCSLSPASTMGRLRRSRVHNARRDVHRAARTRVSGSMHLIWSVLITVRLERGIWIRSNSLTSIRRFVSFIGMPGINHNFLALEPSRSRGSSYWLWKTRFSATLLRRMCEVGHNWTRRISFSEPRIDTTRRTQLCNLIGEVKCTNGDVNNSVNLHTR